MLLFYWRKQYGVNLLAQPNTQIVGIRNLRTGTGILNVGVSYVGFAVAQDVARLNISGKLHTEGDVRIGKGCRLDIGPQATVHIGEGTYLNPYTRIVSLHGLRIGKYCAISWECQFLDEDFHAITYETPRPAKDPRITVGDHVWIGSRVSVFKGATIPTGCVVASGAVVTKAFTEENCLLAGNPAEVVRRNITWE
ncbi:acyltransferase [Hymenobacter tibetensis]|uniref:Acyltransferase n=1 Tax=Hymenobacter tibetensis TaxID=497967 RepID=A0ABY4D057_9BACT|nr:acyltransferase [Hymenobacter tibetensis]UOG75712.1 acyltransferase [Hymenobacter tibetensis]